MNFKAKLRILKNKFLQNPKLTRELQANRLLLGKRMAREVASLPDNLNIHDAEFQVFSQWGDDGIIQYLISKVDIANKFFIEFGVENYTESNTRFLLMNNNWSGLIMDGSKENMDYVRNDHIFWKYDLRAKNVFVTAENIDELIESEGISGNIGILHVDIDGNDFWIWKKISSVDADIVIVEFNSVFGTERCISVPYDPAFVRSQKHYSNLYFGASLNAFVKLGEEKDYVFVGCNSSGNNAYFVKKSKAGRLKALTTKEGYVMSKFQEARNKQRQLTNSKLSERLDIIKGLEVINTETNTSELI